MVPPPQIQSDVIGRLPSPVAGGAAAEAQNIRHQPGVLGQGLSVIMGRSV